jgi:putative DNA primase/helicase
MKCKRRNAKAQRQAWLREHVPDAPPNGKAAAVKFNKKAQSETAGEGKRKEYHLTEFGNSERFFDLYRDRVRFNHTSNKWHIWTATRWAEDETRKTAALVKNISRVILEEAAQTVNDDKRNRLAKYALVSETARVLTNTLNLASSKQELAVRSEWMDQNPNLFNITNGTIELNKNGFIFREHRKEDNITKIANVEYTTGAACPRWEKFIERIFRTPEGTSDPALMGFIQRALALSLTGDTSEQVLFFAYGNGSNGKSTLFETVKNLFGDYYQKAPVDMLLAKKNTAIPNDIARLVGTRFVVSNETQSGRQINEAIVKDLTGGDTITARFLRQEYFEFEPTHKLWIYGNHKPVVKNNDDGIWRRLLLIPFEQKIEGDEKDEHLKQKLFTELPGVLNWILQGWKDYCKNGLQVPERVKVASRAYRDEMNNAYKFLDECCEFKSTYTIPVKSLYDTYKLWCGANGEFPVKKSEFKERLIQQGRPEPGSGNQNKSTWLGVRLNQETIEEFHPNKGLLAKS